MSGAPNAKGRSTHIHTMPVFVWPALNEFSGHAVRDLLHHWSERAGLQPEKRNQGFSYPNALAMPTWHGVGWRTFLCHLISVPLLPLTCQLRPPSDRRAVVMQRRKVLPQPLCNTAQECQPQGVNLRPLIVESTGAWEPEAAHFLKALSRAAAAREQSTASILHSHFLQELCVTVRSYRGRPALAMSLCRCRPLRMFRRQLPFSPPCNRPSCPL